MAAKKPASDAKKKISPKAGQPHRWKKGESGNPAGRPKDGESWTGVIRDIANKNAEELAEMVGGRATDLGRAFLQMPKGVQIKYLMTMRAMAGFMFEPNSSLWNSIMERTDGKVKDTLDITSGGKPVKGYIGISPEDWDKLGGDGSS